MLTNKQLEEIAHELSTRVQETEPGSLTYQWFRTGTAEEPKIIVIEMYVFSPKIDDEEAEMLTRDRYADQAAFDLHLAGPPLAGFIETEKKEGNFKAPIELLSLEQFAGFTRLMGGD